MARVSAVVSTRRLLISSTVWLPLRLYTLQRKRTKTSCDWLISLFTQSICVRYGIAPNVGYLQKKTFEYVRYINTSFPFFLSLYTNVFFAMLFQKHCVYRLKSNFDRYPAASMNVISSVFKFYMCVYLPYTMVYSQ